jgi:hypothetical protein
LLDYLITREDFSFSVSLDGLSLLQMTPKYLLVLKKHGAFFKAEGPIEISFKMLS